MPQFAQRRDGRVGLRHRPKGVVVQRQLATVERRPWYAGTHKPGAKPVALESPSVIDAEVAVDGRYQLVLDAAPTLPQELKGRNVDRDANMFHGGHRTHVSAAQNRMAEPLGADCDLLRHGIKQQTRRVHIFGAVVEDGDTVVYVTMARRTG